MRWAVKSSFLHYVRTIGAGSYEVLDGAIAGADEVFEFPLLDAVESAENLTLSFGGGVHFTAHHGFLDVIIREIRVEFAERGTISIATTGGERAIIAVTPAAAPVETDGVLRWEDMVPSLTELGVAVLGNAYPTGAEMSPMNVAVTLGS